jgi:hypothetical protein
MTHNNFDQSSTGTNIEVSCFYDTDTSRRLFDENFQVIQSQSYDNSTIAYYIDNGNVQDSDSLMFNIKGSDESINGYLIAQGYDESEVKERMDRQESEDEIINSLRPNILNYQELNEYDLKDTGLSFEPSKNLVSLTTRGYSQGDYATVYYCPSDLATVWGNEPDESQLQKLFDNLFWDAPVFASVTINDTEYNQWDMPDYNEYDFDRAAFIAWVSVKSGVSVETLGSLTPKTPEYL